MKKTYLILIISFIIIISFISIVIANTPLSSPQNRNYDTYVILCDEIIQLEKKEFQNQYSPAHRGLYYINDTSLLVLTEECKERILRYKFSDQKIVIKSGHSRLELILVQDSLSNYPEGIPFCLLNGNNIIFNNEGKLPIYYILSENNNEMTQYIDNELSIYSKNRVLNIDNHINNDSELFLIDDLMIDYYDSVSHLLYLNKIGATSLNERILNSKKGMYPNFIIRIDGMQKNIYPFSTYSSSVLESMYPNNEVILDDYLVYCPVEHIANSESGNNNILVFIFALNYFYKDLDTSCINIVYL